jgi:hypothetical protein
LAREHRRAGCPFPKLGPRCKQSFQRRALSPGPFLSPTGTQPLTQSPAYRPSPPFPEPAPGDLAGTGLWGGLASSSFLPLPYLRPALHGRLGPRAEKGGGGHPPGRCHMLPRPKSPLQVPAPAAVPSQARPPQRPTRGPPLPPPDGREGSGSPKEVSGEETGTHLPGGGAGPLRARASLVWKKRPSEPGNAWPSRAQPAGRPGTQARGPCGPGGPGRPQGCD